MGLQRGANQKIQELQKEEEKEIFKPHVGNEPENLSMAKKAMRTSMLSHFLQPEVTNILKPQTFGNCTQQNSSIELVLLETCTQ